MSDNLKTEHPSLFTIRHHIDRGRRLLARDRICKFLNIKYRLEPDNKRKLATLQYTYTNWSFQADLEFEDEFAKKVITSLDTLLIELIKDVMGAEDVDILKLLAKEK